MRTLQLTHLQIELICSALGIAEQHYAEMHKRIIELSNHRNNTKQDEERKQAMPFLDRSGSYFDLNYSIANSELDV